MLILGVLFSYGGYIFARKRKLNENSIKDRHLFMTDKEIVKADLMQTLSIFLYPGSFLLILFSSADYKFNMIFILLANFVLYPLFYGVLDGIDSNKKLNKTLKKSGIKLP